MSLPAFSVRNSVLVNMLMLVILAAGIVFAITLQREMFPESRPDKLLVSAVYPGVQPEDVEKAVTIKIEEALRGLEGIETVESQVAEGVSFTTLTLAQSVDDVDVMLQEIRNEVDSIQDMPDGVEKISLRKVEPQLPVISVAIYSHESEAALKQAARNLRNDLLKLPGVSRVELNGIRDDEIYVDVQPDKLLEYDITFEEIAAAIRAENVDVSGGQLKGNRSSVSVRTLGEQQHAVNLEQIVVRSRPSGQQILLSDVATLSDGFVDSDLESLFNGQPSVNCVLFKGKGEDTVQISAVVKTYVAARSGQPYTGPSNGVSQLMSVVGRPNLYEIYQQAKSNPFPKKFGYKLHTDIARFVEGRLELMTRNGRMGLILVLISLNLFLNWRVALWAAFGLVISFMGTFAVMWSLGATVNLLSMFGLIVVLGIIVDDAIVIGENIYRHVEEGMPAMEAAIKGTEEVMWPVIVAVSTTIGAFAPLFFIRGQIGDFMSQLPLVVIAALSISLVEALVILPAHLRHLPPVKKTADGEKLTGVGGFKAFVLHRVLMEPYEKLLTFCLKWRYVTVSVVSGACIVAAGMLSGGIVKWQFIQDMDSESMICALEMPIGTSTERLKEELQKLTNFIVDRERFPEIVNVQTIAGRQYDVTGAGAVGFDDQSHLGQLVVEICPAEQRDRSSEELTTALREFSESQLTGVNSVRWTEMNGGPGGNDIEISLSGVSDSDLPKAVNDLKKIIGTLQGVYDLDDNLDIGKKELRLSVRDSATAAGVTVGSLGTHVRGALFGQEARRITRNREDVRIMVRYPETFRDSTWNVESMWIPGQGLPGERKWIPISEVAEVNMGIGYSTITRYQQTRSAKVVGAVDDASVPSTTSVIDTIRARAEAEIIPRYPGIKIQYLGQAEEVAKSFSSLRMAFPIAMLIIYGMLAGLFKSYTQPLVVMSAIPFGFLGAVIGHWVTGETFTILSAIGLVALAGILVNDSLLLVNFINKRVAAGLSPLDASIDGAKKRLRAILLTTLTTAAGLAPLMFETSFQAKFLIPMAVTLTFGLLFATLLTLILVPCLNLIREDVLTGFFGFRTTPEKPKDPTPSDVAPLSTVT
ncbi:MAG: efflux RND transporter permease subunit [Fuerstiella sp.]|nr:efflux RND transporter permease subunit [Fuerstiella sp.]MCP4856622.1 efflux RND transporter permease subunit [Fuerstiella sp.]